MRISFWQAASGSGSEFSFRRTAACCLLTYADGMLHIVHVAVHVKADRVDAFKAATVDNARNSVLEPGVARFDVVQQVDDPTRFMLLEVYRSATAVSAHKETAHYARWRDTVADMMEEPRSPGKFQNVFPLDDKW
jgi:(4S)-4-hydroxy-5-phosphonooxypentane-2,3-dione isomerase